jgi:phosphoesterase RecJ-like protein
MFEEIISAVNKAENIAILYHINADGDAVGSALGLSFALSKLKKNVSIFAEEEVQNNLKFLPESEKIIIFNSEDNTDEFDLCILLDCGGLNRLGRRIDIYSNSKVKINIDHHKSNEIQSDFNYIKSNASSCGEIIFDLIKEMNCKIDSRVASCIYTAISTDSGSFKFCNTSSKTFRTAAELVDCGASPSEISKNVYDNVPFSKLKLTGKIIDTIELSIRNKLSTLYLNSDMLNEIGENVDDIDNIANYGLSIENVELSIFLKEIEKNKTKVSFRSKNYFDCSEFLKQFGGGGHARAGGCQIEMPIKEAKEILIKKIIDENLIK